MEFVATRIEENYAAIRTIQGEAKSSSVYSTHTVQDDSWARSKANFALKDVHRPTADRPRCDEIVRSGEYICSVSQESLIWLYCPSRHTITFSHGTPDAEVRELKGVTGARERTGAELISEVQLSTPEMFVERDLPAPNPHFSLFRKIEIPSSLFSSSMPTLYKILFVRPSKRGRLVPLTNDIFDPRCFYQTIQRRPIPELVRSYIKNFIVPPFQFVDGSFRAEGSSPDHTSTFTITRESDSTGDTIITADLSTVIRDDPSRHSTSRRCVFGASKGFNLVLDEYVDLDDGTAQFRITQDFAYDADLGLPIPTVYTYESNWDDWPDTRWKTVTFFNTVVNQPLAPDTFTYEKMGFRSDFEIRDFRKPTRAAGE